MQEVIVNEIDALKKLHQHKHIIGYEGFMTQGVVKKKNGKTENVCFVVV